MSEATVAETPPGGVVFDVDRATGQVAITQHTGVPLTVAVNGESRILQDAERVRFVLTRSCWRPLGPGGQPLDGQPL